MSGRSPIERASAPAERRREVRGIGKGHAAAAWNGES